MTKKLESPFNTSSTFIDNMKLPVHRWFRFSAGFSAQWVEFVMIEAKKQGNVTVLDPFAGSGTTLLVSEKVGVECYGIEAHPFILRVAQAKLLYNPHSALQVEVQRDYSQHKRKTIRSNQEKNVGLISGMKKNN